MPQPAASTSRSPSQHLVVDGTSFRAPGGGRTPWRGITAFRLLEMLEAGKQGDVDAFLGWAAQERLTVVRVLAMAKHLFELTPERGLVQLPNLLERAAKHGLFVEIVALADTGAFDFDVTAHVEAIGGIAARHPNALVEIANEPYHPTQRADVRTLATLEQLARAIPRPVPVAVGALDRPDESHAGDYATFHFPRSVANDGWGHVVELAQGHAAMQRLAKPLINDEPIGAGPVFQPGRRDDSPERMRAAALLTRMSGMGATFHYEGGLQARLPQGPELQSFRAWQEAWTLLPADIETAGAFRKAEQPSSAVRRLNGAAAGAWEVWRGNEAWVLIVGTRGTPTVEWADGWRQVELTTWPGSQWRRAVRTSP